MLLWVLAENHPARRFYERLGGVVAGSKPLETRGTGAATVDEVAYGYDLAALLIALSESGPAR